MLLYDGKKVCTYDYTFDKNAAQAICRRMGYDAAIEWETQRPYSNTWFYKYPTAPIYVVCTSSAWSSCTTGSVYNLNRYNECMFLRCLLSCPPGMYLDYGTCVYCPVDTFKDTKGRQTSCTACPNGASSQLGSSGCSCELGKFWDSKNCLSCYTYQTNCPCPAGTIWNGDKANDGFCIPCLSGTYKTKAIPICRDCPSGSTSTPGSDHCICKSGFFWNGSLCEQCPEGSISQIGATACLLCPSKSDYDKTACSCSAGEAWSWENSTWGSCRPCPQGYYSNLTASCKLCPSGAFSLVGSDRCLCPAGKFWSIDSSSCVECGVQSVSQTGSLKCEPCPNGTIDGTACYCPAGLIWEWEGLYRGYCKPCPSGTYETEYLISSCELCLEGYVSQAGSLQCQVCPPGSTDNLIRTVCTCPPDMAWNWSENGVGSCESAPQSDTPLPVVLIPVIVAVVMAIICMYFVALLIIERRKNSWQRNTLTRVAYNRDTGVEIVQDQQNPLYLPWQRSTPAEDDVYNTLNPLPGPVPQ